MMMISVKAFGTVRLIVCMCACVVLEFSQLSQYIIMDMFPPLNMSAR